jgi:GAF domain-containing protein
VSVADTLIADYDVIDLLHSLVENCNTLLETSAGGIVLADSVGDLQVVASTSEGADFVEVMQLASGSGPCVECFRSGMPVAVGDIARDGGNWPEFQAAALDQGFASVYATPLRLRGQILGSMNLFSVNVGIMNVRDAAVAQALADVATIGIIQERTIRESGIVSEQLQRALSSRVFIEQAKGVLSATTSMDVNEAFMTMRAYARSHNLTLSAVAEGVTNRTIDVLADSSVATSKKTR